MLIERAKYEDIAAITGELDADNVFRSCEFLRSSIEGGHVDGTFICCTFEDLEWYWGLFNCCLFVENKFKRCTFRGASFSDCRFVDCSFEDCEFLEDNFGKSCTAKGARIYGSTAKGCKGAEFLFTNVAV